MDPDIKDILNGKWQICHGMYFCVREVKERSGNELN